MGGSGFFKYAHGLCQIGVVGYLDVEVLPQRFAGVRFINHGGSNKRFVRNQRFRAAGAAQHHKTRGDFGNVAGEVVNSQAVARADGAVAQNDKARNIIAGHFLQAEADAHTERTAKHRQHGKIDAHQRQRNQHCQRHQHRGDHFREHDAQIHIEPVAVHQPAVDGARKPEGKHHNHRHPHQAGEYGVEIERDGADGQLHAFEHIDYHIIDAGNPQYKRHPQHAGERAFEHIGDFIVGQRRMHHGQQKPDNNHPARRHHQKLQPHAIEAQSRPSKQGGNGSGQQHQRPQHPPADVAQGRPFRGLLRTAAD